VSTRWPTLIEDGDGLLILDQTCLPREAVMLRLATLDDVVNAIRVMQVRGAPLIGATAAYGVALGLADGAGDARLRMPATRWPRRGRRRSTCTGRWRACVPCSKSRRRRHGADAGLGARRAPSPRGRRRQPRHRRAWPCPCESDSRSERSTS
jgi:hypothetical protein